METSVQNDTKRTYGWAILAATVTALLASVTFLTLSVDSPVADAEMQSFLTITAFLLRVILFVPLYAVAPALWARSAWRSHPAVLVVLSFVAFAVGTAFAGPLVGVCTFGMIAPAGIGLYAAQRLKLSNFKTVFYGSIVLLIGLFIRVSVPTMVSDGDAFLPMRTLAESYRVLWNAMDFDIEALQTIGLSGTTDVLTDTLSDLKLNANEYMIELLYYPAAIAALANVLLSHLFDRKGGADMKRLPAFEDWMIEPSYFYGTLALSFASYVLMLSGQSIGNALVRIAFVLWELPMALLGLCTLKQLSKKHAWIFILAIAATVTMPNFAMQVLSIVGMIGFMRKQMQKRMQGGKQ